MALPKGRLWAAIVLLAIAIAAAKTATALPASRSLRGISAPAAVDAPNDPVRVTGGLHTRLSPVASKSARDAVKALGIGTEVKPVSGTGTVLFNACGAGPKFRSLPCDPPSIDLTDRQSRVITLDNNYIECGSGDSEGGKREVYHIELYITTGTRSFTGQPGYFARARIMHDRKTLPDQRYCWLRLDAGGDGGACLCAVALQGSTLGRRSDCHCESV